MYSYKWIIFHQLSRAAYKSGLGVLCGVAMIYDKASFVHK